MDPDLCCKDVDVVLNVGAVAVLLCLALQGNPMGLDELPD